MNSMISTNIGTASTKAAKSSLSCATIQMATRLPITGTARYSGSSSGRLRASSAAAAAWSACAWS